MTEAWPPCKGEALLRGRELTLNVTNTAPVTRSNVIVEDESGMMLRQQALQFILDHLESGAQSGLLSVRRRDPRFLADHGRNSIPFYLYTRPRVRGRCCPSC